LTTGKSPVAIYFNDISPGPPESELRFRVIHFSEAINIDSDATFHILWSCSNPEIAKRRLNIWEIEILVDSRHDRSQKRRQPAIITKVHRIMIQLI
ncbi:hypothetical protein HID58_043309, partial [Brassica napus]